MLFKELACLANLNTVLLSGKSHDWLLISHGWSVLSKRADIQWKIKTRFLLFPGVVEFPVYLHCLKKITSEISEIPEIVCFSWLGGRMFWHSRQIRCALLVIYIHSRFVFRPGMSKDQQWPEVKHTSTTAAYVHTAAD